VLSSLRSASRPSPAARYLSAAVFIPSISFGSRNLYSSNYIFDKSLNSQQANYIGSIVDSVLFYGGDPGLGSFTFDGSSGSLLGDAWMLRLANSSTASGRIASGASVRQTCDWRLRSPSGNAGGANTCFLAANSTCDFRKLVTLAWCLGEYQTI
jgi:hypothetical protein